MTFPRLPFVILAAVAALSAPAFGQGAQVAFGGIRADPTLPVEVTSEAFSVNQTDGSATFSGDVLIAQGEMRLSAAEVRVEYATGDQRKINRLIATGGVTLASGKDAAEASEAEYSVATGVVILRGDVLLTQGPNAISGQVLTVDLTTGTGKMEGRVRTILNPGGN
jgi:lipopolysaccharide export system protein LptA